MYRSEDEKNNVFDTSDSVDSIIKPYSNGKCELTCHQAIDLLNRYCVSLDINMCNVLYPIYLFTGNCCKLRLPPNSVFNQTIEVNLNNQFILSSQINLLFFPKSKLTSKKLSKMEAALEMCKQLNQRSSILNFLSSTQNCILIFLRTIY